ncbi:MAG: filamentous hemagglutinin N-terminal domain-containing protein [Nitrospira sp.]|nr:filamentous hemagglutinin N-terminal domain-containing protein [Nitrospira sp.]
MPIRSLPDARTLAAIFFFCFVWLSFEVVLAQSQVVTAIAHTSGAGDLGTRTTTQGHTIQITGGTRSDNGTGPNLFHSFDQFSVGHRDTAQFLNTTPSIGTDNILGRVTGGNPSYIFGTINTTSYPGANLFLLNPAGIIFGPNATLTVSGSVAFTTADYLRLSQTNGASGIFHVSPGIPNVLSSAPVAAFGFLNPTPAAIFLQGSNLEAPPGQSITLVGGNITIESGRLGNIADPPNSSTPGKQVLITSVASQGEVSEGILANSAHMSPETLGTIRISQGSAIDTRGNGGGAIRIRGGRLIVENSLIGSNTGDILLTSDSTQLKNAGIITFTTTTANAGHITLESSGDIVMDSQASIESFSERAAGHAGNIALRSNQGNVYLREGSSITSQTSQGSGNTSNIEIITSHGDVRLLDKSVIFTSASGGTGTIGSIKIVANNLELHDGSRIDGDNFSTQAARSTDIILSNSLKLDGQSEIETGTTGTAAAADLIITAREVRLADGGKLSADATTSSSGPSGTISIRGPQSLIDSTLLLLIDGPGSGVYSRTQGTGAAGNIAVNASSVTLQNGGTLSASTFGIAPSARGGSITLTATDQLTLHNNASITASTSGSGNAGNILVRANDITISRDSTITSSSASTGSGGNIALRAGQSVTIKDGATVSSSSTGSGIAGNIEINAGKQLDVERGLITTQSNQLNGGNINIQAIDLVRVVDGEISTSALNGGGNGGNITIDPKVVLLQNSEVLAQANRGTGGDISITTPVFIADQSSRIDASTPFGLNGRITIQSPTSNLSGTVGQLVSKTSPPQVLLQNRCVALAGGEQSTFLLAGRDALPSEPSGWLSSPVSVEHWTREDTAHASRPMAWNQNVDSLPVMAGQKNKPPIFSLRRLTPSGFLVRTFAPRATGCPS